MNLSLDKLVENLWDEDFKYLVEECGFDNLKILKQKGASPYEYMNSFKRFNEENCVLQNIFMALQKKERLIMM